MSIITRIKSYRFLWVLMVIELVNSVVSIKDYKVNYYKDKEFIGFYGF